MTLEYLELVILQLIGYADRYRSRTGRFDKAVKLVPWEEALEGGGDNTDQDTTMPKGSEMVADS